MRTCNSTGTAWVTSTCLDYQMCTNGACWNACDLRATPSIPTTCLVPNGDGVNLSEFAYWNVSTMANPTYVVGGAWDPTSSDSASADVYADTTLTWPYYWFITSGGLAYVKFTLNQFAASPKTPKLIISAKRCGFESYTDQYYGEALVNSTSIGSDTWGSVTTAWATPSLDVSAPNNAQLNYTGATNQLSIAITGDGLGDPVDCLYVNWVMLQIQ